MKPTADESDELRPHSYDGIQEFDKRLPNWWLFTLYGAIAFAFAYWVVYHSADLNPSPGPALEQQMKENAKLAAMNAKELTDETLWKMSQDTAVTDAGKATFLTTCAACHQADLSGAIGPNLKDTAWVHGGKPADIMKIITEGFAAKGMPTWGPILGRQKIAEVSAYILSFHKEGEPVTIAPWVPIAPGAPAPAAAP